MFVAIYLLCQVEDHNAFWEKNWELLSEDIEYRLKHAFGSRNYTISYVELKEYVLVTLDEEFGNRLSSLAENKLLTPSQRIMQLVHNRLLYEKLDYNIRELQEAHIQLLNSINDEQLEIY